MPSKITKIVLDIDGKEIELTPAQAKELMLILKEMYEQKEKIVPQPYPVPKPIPVPVYPDPYDEWPWRKKWRRPYWSGELKQDRNKVTRTAYLSTIR